MTNSTPFQAIQDLKLPIKYPLLWAIVGFVVYFIAVILGSEVQSLVGLKLQMGWSMQIISALVVVLYAFLLKEPKTILGWKAPEKGWAMPLIIVSVGSILFGELAEELLINPSPSPSRNFEYFLYESLMPGLGEELGLRGVFLGLLLVYALQKNYTKIGIWVLVVIHAIPFGLAHILEVEGIDAIVIFSYTSLVAVALAWLRLKTGSIWVCILCHNIINVGGGIIAVLFS